MKKYSAKIFTLCLVSFFICSCSTTYYKVMETLGTHKRDILVDRVEAARDSQEEAGEQFKTALEKFRDVVKFEGGELESRYNSLNGEYEKSLDRANKVSERIKSVEKVADDLFAEWENEMNEYTNQSMRASSEKMLKDTRQKYAGLIVAMKKAESKMPPVLSRLKDQVLFLKHNLNAQAIGSLQGEATQLESDVDALLAELEKSISEANEFIEGLK